jgi:hypothetical protein
VSGVFFDLRGLDPTLSREERWKIGASIPNDADGVVFRPAERSSAMCIAILKAGVLGRSLQTVHYRYVWNGTRVTKLYAFDNEGAELAPEVLAGPADVLAA